MGRFLSLLCGWLHPRSHLHAQPRRHSSPPARRPRQSQTSWPAHHRYLSFDHWDFSDAEDDSELRIVLDPLNLPRQLADEAAGAARMSVLNVTGREPLKLVFRSVPAPAEVPASKHWRIQLLAVGGEGATVAWESNSYALRYDALRRYLTSEEERSASQLALLMLAGHRSVNAPWAAEFIL